MRLHRVGDERDVGVLPALDAVGDHEAPAERERHRAERRGDRVRRAGVALEQLDAAGAALALGHRAQPRAALGDAAVVVAVDQVGGAEGGHARASLDAAAVAVSAPRSRRIRPPRHVQPHGAVAVGPHQLAARRAARPSVDGAGWP